MAILQANTPVLHRKEWQQMNPLPVTPVAGSSMVAPDSGNFNDAMYVQNASVQYLYHHDEDAFVIITGASLAGTFGAGACGVRHPWSAPYTANGGSTTTVTVAAGTHNITGLCVGKTIEFVSAGIASGFRSTVTRLLNNAGSGTITITFADAAPTTILTSHTFRFTTGRYYLLGAGTLASGSFKVYDVCTGVWTTLVNTGLPATWGTDGKLVIPYNFNETFATGTATAGAGTTLTNSAKTWTTNQWTNYQIRITAGTGVGQTRTIASNTGTVITVSAAWTTNPDATSQYAIEANEDWIFALGNGAVTMYRYSISGNSWSTVAPTAARAGAPGGGMSATAIGNTGDPVWGDESAILNGRYIYSLRGNGTATLDRFDIAGGTAGAGTWAQVTYVGAEGFNNGSSAFAMGRYIYMRNGVSNRYFKYSVRGNYLEPLSFNFFAEGVALLGQKIWVKNLESNGNIKWLYAFQNSGTAMHRLPLF